MLSPFLIRYAVVAVAVAGFFTVTNHYENKGYNRAITEIQGKSNEAIVKATEKAVDEAAIEMQKAIDKQQTIHDMELSRVSEVKKVGTEIKEVIRYVDKIEIRNECNTVSDGVIGLLNKSINKVNKTSG